MTLVWSPDSVNDLRALRDYIEEFNPAAAAEVAARIIEAVELLVDFPGIGRVGRKPNTRELVVPGTPYFVPYRVVDGRVEIIGVIHGARKWPSD